MTRCAALAQFIRVFCISCFSTAVCPAEVHRFRLVAHFRWSNTALKFLKSSPIFVQPESPKRQHLPQIQNLCVISKFRHQLVQPFFPLRGRQLQVVPVFRDLRLQNLTLHFEHQSECVSAVANIGLVPRFNFIQTRHAPSNHRGLRSSVSSQPDTQLSPG